MGGGWGGKGCVDQCFVCQCLVLRWECVQSVNHKAEEKTRVLRTVPNMVETLRIYLKSAQPE
jgi:hypothetical protein